MQTCVLSKPGEYQNHVDINENHSKVENAPACHMCGEPMKLEWSDITAGTRQNWSCSGCSTYRIVNPNFTETKMLFSTSSYPGKPLIMYTFAPSPDNYVISN